MSCITGNGLKTLDVLFGRYDTAEPVKPRLAAFDEYLRRTDSTLIGAGLELEEPVLMGGVQ